MNDQKFLDHIEHSAAEVTAARISVADLRDIYQHHAANENNLLQAGEAIQSTLRKVGAVHSTRVRVKTPKSLARKIVRKQTDDPKRNITLENYEEDVRDLIGLRALHLFKRDWKLIHKEILDIWKLHPKDRKPLAYHRGGDSPELRQEWKNAGCKVEERSAGYRSIHYVIVSKPNNRERYCAEIQVRTIFDEGWGEIDHHIRYPDDPNDPLLQESLLILNRMAGSADEMGGFLLNLLENQRVLEFQREQDAAEHAEMRRELEEVKQALTQALEEKSSGKEQNKELREFVERIDQITKPPSPPAPSAMQRIVQEQVRDAQRIIDSLGNVGGRTNSDWARIVGQSQQERLQLAKQLAEMNKQNSEILANLQRQIKPR